jgi:hypothetical protein
MLNGMNLRIVNSNLCLNEHVNNNKIGIWTCDSHYGSKHMNSIWYEGSPLFNGNKKIPFYNGVGRPFSRVDHCDSFDWRCNNWGLIVQ